VNQPTIKTGIVKELEVNDALRKLLNQKLMFSDISKRFMT
jgi:hypothetical protein